jgi:thiamine-phosphate pyrophosphorylase
MADRCLLYYITGRSQFRGDESARRRALLAKIAEAAREGVDYIQLREKDLGTRELETLAREVLSVARNSSPLRPDNRELRTRLLINSRTDIALAVGADGVHLRATDVAPHEVRQMLSISQGLKPASLSACNGTAECRALPKGAEVSAHRPPASGHFFVAASCHTVADVFRAESEKADFAVFGPVFEKKDAPLFLKETSPAEGLAALREACRAKIPVFGLGGVTLENAASCLNAGAAGIAAIRLFQEHRIEDVVRALRTL